MKCRRQSRRCGRAARCSARTGDVPLVLSLRPHLGGRRLASGSQRGAAKCTDAIRPALGWTPFAHYNRRPPSNKSGLLRLATLSRRVGYATRSLRAPSLRFPPACRGLHAHAQKTRVSHRRCGQQNREWGHRALNPRLCGAAQKPRRPPHRRQVRALPSPHSPLPAAFQPPPAFPPLRFGSPASVACFAPPT